jgi:hypothetical protein
MLNPNALFSQQVALVGIIDADAYAAGAVSTGWIAAKNFDQFLAIVAVGDMVATSTVDGKLEQATDGAGTGAKDITGKAITQFTAAGTDSNKQALINLRPEELDIANNFTHFRLTMTVATAASDAMGIVLGGAPRIGNANENDLAAVDEIVA